MFVTIRQTRADRENRFQVEDDQGVLFLASTPWSDLNLPLDAERLRKLTFTDTDGTEIFHTDYHLLDNTVQALTRHKYLLGESTKLAEYQVVDREGTARGSFYTQIDGMFTSQLTITCGERQYDCYHVTRGKIYVISVFDGERQIAQITKSLDTWDQLDVYYLHLLDDSRELLPILSFFVIYVDAMQFNRAGRFVKHSVEKGWGYSVNRNDRWYNPQWIAETFGPAAMERLEAKLKEKPPRRAGSPRRTRTIVVLAVAAVVLVTVVLAVLLFAYSRPKTALSQADFTRRMEESGYTVTDLSGDSLDQTWEGACQAVKGSCQVQFLEAASEDAAQHLFAQLESQLSSQAAGSNRQSYLSGVNSEKYTLVSGGSCYIAARVGDTVVICAAEASDEGELKAVMRTLGY